LLEEFAYETCEVALEPGDNLLLYSDGILDAPNLQHASFSIKGVQHVLEESGAVSAPTMGQRLIQAVERHVENQSWQDDITLVCLGRTT
jgi:sigma-B regulation protein RsbU (phosphoserine phosphatase)